VSLLDLLVLVIIGASVITGFVAGFARVGIGFAGAVAGILLGFWFYGMPAAWVHTYVKSQTTSNLIGFFLVFWACLLIAALIGKLVSKIFKWTGLSWVDKTMGAFFGLVRGAIISTAFIAVVMAFTPKPAPNWMVNSKVLPYAMGVTSAVAALAPNSIKEAFRVTAAEIKETWNAQLKKTKDELSGIGAQLEKTDSQKKAEPEKKEPSDNSAPPAEKKTVKKKTKKKEPAQ
jgi:membrane protein required for colicin V production